MELRAEKNAKFNQVFTTSRDVVRGLQTQITDLNRTQRDVSAFERKQSALQTNREELQRNTLEYERLQREQELMGGTSKDLARRIEKNKKEFWEKSEQIKETERDLGRYNQQLRDSGVDTSNLAAEKRRLTDEIEKLSNKQKNIATLESWQQRNSAVLSDAKRDFALATGVVAGFSAAVYKGAVKPAADLEQSMSQLNATVQWTGDDLSVLKDEIRGVSRATGISAADIAKASRDLVDINSDLGLVTSQLEHGANLAIATGTDMAYTFDFLSATMKTFGKDEAYTRDMVDSLASTSVRTNMSLSEMGQAFTNVGGMAVQAGVGVDNVNAKLAIMSEAGLRGGAAGTSLNAIYRNLTAPTGAAVAALDELGIALYDNYGYSRDMIDIMGDTETALASLSDEYRNKRQQQIFDQVALKGWNMITAEGIDYVRELSDDISGAKYAFEGVGQAAGMAAEMQDNLNTDMAIAKNNVRDLGISIGDALMPEVRDMVGGFGDTVAGISSWVQENPELVRTIGRTASTVGLATVAFTGTRMAILLAKRELINFKLLQASGAAALTGKKGMVAGLAKLGPKGLIAAGAVAAVSAAVVIHRRRIQSLREEYADPLLFDNGGVRLTELTDNLIENNRFMSDHAREIVNTRERMAENRVEIERASREIEFYGRSLRENGTLTPEDVERMRAPFGQLVDGLKTQFQGSFEVIYGGLKGVSYDVLNQVGFDVAGVSDVLRTFRDEKMGYLGGLTARKESYIETGDMEGFQRVLNEAADVENIIGDRRREGLKLAYSMEGMDFEDFDSVRANLERIEAFREENIRYFTEAKHAIRAEARIAKEFAQYLYKNTDKTHEEFSATVEAIVAARDSAIYQKAYNIDEINSQVGSLATGILEGLKESAENVYENAGFFDKAFAALVTDSLGGRLSGAEGWHDKYIRRVLGEDVSGAMDDAKSIIESTDLPSLHTDLIIRKRIEGGSPDIAAGLRDGTIPTRPTLQAGLAGLTAARFATAGFADGGIIERPIVAAFAERVPEAAIPLENTPRSRGLYAEAGRRMGILDFTPKPAASAPVISVNYSPQVTANGVADLDRKLREHTETVVIMIQDVLAEEKLNESRTRYA